MAVSSAVKKLSVNVKLNNGTSGGVVKTVSLSLGNLKTTAFDAQKAMNIVSLLGDCLSKPVYTVEKVEVSTLTESE